MARPEVGRRHRKIVAKNKDLRTSAGVVGIRLGGKLTVHRLRFLLSSRREFYDRGTSEWEPLSYSEVPRVATAPLGMTAATATQRCRATSARSARDPSSSGGRRRWSRRRRGGRRARRRRRGGAGRQAR